MVEELNAKMQGDGGAPRAPCSSISTTPLLPEVNTVIGVDGLHPTEVGYKRIADVFFAAIQANLEVK